MLTLFSMAALLLAAVRIYGTCRRRWRTAWRWELSFPPRCAWFCGTGSLMLAGIVPGTVSAAGLTPLMGKMLFEVRPLDPAVFAFAVVVLAGFALLACYVPSRRPTRVDPLETLRQEA